MAEQLKYEKGELMIKRYDVVPKAGMWLPVISMSHRRSLILHFS